MQQTTVLDPASNTLRATMERFASLMPFAAWPTAPDIRAPMVDMGCKRGDVAVKVIAVVNRGTGERLSVELEIGQTLWVRDGLGQIERVERDQLPEERWQLIEARPVVGWDYSTDYSACGSESK